MTRQLSDHFDILGLVSCDSASQLKTAYRREISKWHPDRFCDNYAEQVNATERAKRINVAYECLSELLEDGHTLRRGRGPSNASAPPDNYRTRHTYNRRSFTPGFPDSDVFEVFVKSSHIVSSGYSRAHQILYIKFDSNIVYGYLRVPELIFTAFIAADSHGTFANQNIYRKFEFLRY